MRTTARTRQVFRQHNFNRLQPPLRFSPNVTHHAPIFHRSRHSPTSEESRLPRVLQPSIWQSIIPQGLRSGVRILNPVRLPSSTKKPPNPASYFIWIYLFIGSQAIRILTLQTDHTTYMRKSSLKIAQLREVIRKLQAGEDVDVETALGTGDEIQEREWEDALREIEEEEKLWQGNRKRRREERRRIEEERKRKFERQEDASPVKVVEQEQGEDQEEKVGGRTTLGFY